MKLWNPDYNLFHWRYWLGQVDSRPLSLFRIAFSLIVIKNAIYLLPLADDFYAENGVTPLRTFIDNGLYRESRFSLMDAMPHTWMALVFFVLWGLIGFFLMIGYRTRLMVILNFLFVLSVHERNIYVLNGSDTVMRVLSFWMLFLPLGHYYSVDAIRRHWSRYLKSRDLDDLRVSDQVYTTFALPLRMVQIQVALIYLFTSILKLPDSVWERGDAIFMALQVRTLTLPTGDLFLQEAPMPLMQFMTLFSLVTEMAFIFLMFVPLLQPYLRMLGLTMGTLLHLGIAVLMAVPNFSMMMIFSYITLFEARWVRWIDEKLRLPRQRLTIGLPMPNSPLWLLLAVTRPSEIVVAREVVHPMDRPWVLDGEDQPRSDETAEHLIAAHLPLSRLWAWLEPIRKFLFWLGGLIVRLDPLPLPTMPEAVRLYDQPLPPRPDYRYLRLIWKGVQAAILIPMMILVIWTNLRQINDADRPEWVQPIPENGFEAMRYVGLWQGWDMFAPYPITVDGWFQIPGYFEDDTSFDLRTREPISDAMPRWFWGPQERWKKYESNLNSMRTSALLGAWGSYYCRIYNNDHVYGELPEGKRLAWLEIHWRYRYSTDPEDGAPEFDEYEDVELWRHWCFSEYSNG